MLLVHAQLQHRLAARDVSGFVGKMFFSRQSQHPEKPFDTLSSLSFINTSTTNDHDATKSIEANLHAAIYRQCWPSEPKKKSFFSVFNKTISFPTSSPSSGLTSVRNHLMKPKQHLYACSGEWTLKTKVERKRKWRWIFREYNFRRAGCWAIPSSQFGGNVRTANWSIILRRALPIPIIMFNAFAKKGRREIETRERRANERDDKKEVKIMEMKN